MEWKLPLSPGIIGLSSLKKILGLDTPDPIADQMMIRGNVSLSSPVFSI